MNVKHRSSYSNAFKAEWPTGRRNTMAEREHIKRSGSPSEADEVEELPEASETGEKLKADMDDLLDEIDEVLETNAEDFVKSYIQKGGQ